MRNASKSAEAIHMPKTETISISVKRGMAPNFISKFILYFKKPHLNLYELLLFIILHNYRLNENLDP